MKDQSDLAQGWLAKAESDLSTAKWLLEGSGPYDTACFHAQQAVEKSVKAWLSVLGVSFPRTHDLELLFALVEEHGDAVPDELRHLVDLTDFAVQYRYEAFTDLGEELDRPTITKRVKQLVEHVEKRLSELTG